MKSRVNREVHARFCESLALFAAMIEGSLLAHQSAHAAHPGRELRILDIQFDISRELALMTVGAQIVWTPDSHRAYNRQNGLGTQFPVMGALATSAGDRPLLFCLRG
jgi:hypothetical protein